MAESNAKSSSANTADREIVITRVFDAPRELVFKVWTDPNHVAHWWGPIGFMTTIHEMYVNRYTEKNNGIKRRKNMAARKNGPSAESSGRELVIRRIFDAPRELVWKAWTEPERMMQWWGPKNFTSPACKIDFRVGGKYLFCMRSPEGQEFWKESLDKLAESLGKEKSI